jgi:gas vesicle protein
MNLNTVKSNLSDLASSTLDHVADTLKTGQEVLSDTSKTVGKDVSRTASKVLHSDPVSSVADKISTVGKVIAAATSAKAIAAALNPEMPLQWALRGLNLQRRPSAFSRVMTGVGLVAVGAAVGAGIAMLLTPQNGEQNRATLRRTLKGMQHNAEEAADQVETTAREVAGQVETKAREVADKVETTARGVIGDGHDGHDGHDGIASDESQRSPTGASGTGGPTKPRTPGLSHRSPKA